MTKQSSAIALCRVSSLEQLENNSLNRQKESVLQAALKLGVTIPNDGWWSGSVSSKKGTNLSRKDLAEMLDYCRKNKDVKYLIVDRPDRFMRSIDEAIYFEVEFRKHGVKVWYASDDELNNDNLMSKFLKFTKYFSAEGSNDDRVEQSIGGALKALQEGRYPFAPKPGYRKGIIKGVPDVHPVRGPALQKVLLDIYFRRVTPTQALINLNNSAFMQDGHSLYKMDKFRKIATDPFYAGVVEINKQVQVRNENGLHAPLITLEQHRELIDIFDNKKKTQKGPRKNGNPDYPLSNLVTCKLCANTSTIPRYAGYRHGNGKNPNLVYHKYRCRACNRYLTRDELHPKIEQQFRDNPITKGGVDDLIEALDIVWKRREAKSKQDAQKISKKLDGLEDAINSQVLAAIEPSNASIKQEILNSVARNKNEVEVLEKELKGLKQKADTDRERFLRYAFDFADNMGSRFLTISQENRLRCKQIVFPAGFYLDAKNNVYTPEISELIRLAGNKKDLSITDKSHLVRVKRL